MVEFIIGPAKSGKTRRCYEGIQEALKEEAYHNLIMLVPEQFNLQVQVELANLLHPGLLRVEVMSFKNLAQRILKEVGGGTEPLIDDLERVMILKKLLEEHKSELKYFKKGYSSEGFIDGMNRLITIFEQNAIDDQTLKEMGAHDGVSEVFKCKLEDMAHIREWFETYIGDKFITVEKTMERLAASVGKSQYLEKASIWVDGFYGFTVPQMNILSEMMDKATHLVITLPMDKYYTKEEYILPNNPFYDSIRQYQRLISICDERHIPYRITQGEMIQEEATAFDYLKEHYLKSYVKPYGMEQEDVVIRSYGNKEEEVEKTARLIKDLVRDKGYRYHDIAVLVGDLNNYKSNVISFFKEYDIPLFIDDKRSIHTNSLVAVISSALDVLTSRWNYKSMMGLLRLQMFGLSREELDALDNYLLEHGIQGENKWITAWERQSSWIDLDEINGIREKVVHIIVGLKENISKAKDNKGRIRIKDATIAVYHFLESIHAYETIEERIAYYEAQGEGALVQENTQIWGQVMETLERLVDILGDESVSISVYKNILKTSFSYIKMGIIPPSKDQVIVGTVDRTRLPQVKAIFVLGVNEGVIPKFDDSMNLFSEMDKLTLHAMQKEKKDQVERLTDVLVNQPVFSGQFLVYSVLTRAKEKLVLSTVLRDESGKSLRPSMVFYKLKKMFGTSQMKEEVVEKIQGPIPTLGYIGEKLRQYLEEGDAERLDPVWQDTMSWYMEQEEWHDKILGIAKDFVFTNQQHYLKKENAKLLYPDGLQTSISQLETYRQCPCCYFIKYGIKASERKILEWNAADLGTLFHATLERYPKELEKINHTWTDVTDVQMEECVQKAVEYSAAKTNYGSRMDGRVKYTLSKVSKMSKRAIRALTYQLKQGKFVPHAYEVNFGYEGMPAIEIVLDEENTILLKGQIDRVDIYVKDAQEAYIKILDYKSGNKNFDLLEVYHCLQLQLLLYLDAYLRLNPGYKAAGMFYFHINSKNIKYELGMEEVTIAERQIKQFRLSGLAVDDVEIIRLMDEKGQGEVVPAKLKKDGALAATSSVATEGQFQVLRNYMLEKIKVLGKEMLAGRVSAMPYKLKERDGCIYCKYHTICQFDTNALDNEYERLEALRDKQIWEALCPKEVKGEA